jgi:tetratricopeptide (TPR) repeat protein
MDLSKHLQNAADAVKRRNYAQAVQLYGQLLALQPDNGEARAGLRQALFKRAEAKPPSKLFALLGGGPNLLFAALARLLGKHAAAAGACERYLALDPLDERVNLRLGDALERAGHRQSALAVYRAYAQAQPRCLAAARAAGRLLYETGELDAALGMFEQALRIDPRDQESLKARKNLAAEGALKQSKIESAQSSRELIKDKQGQRELERGQRLQLTKEELAAELDDAEAKLAENPDDRALLLRVADLRRIDGDLRGALDCAERAAQLAPEDRALAAKAGDLRLRLQEQIVAEAEARGDQAAAAQAARVLADLRAAELRRRIAEQPMDLALRFELGKALLARGDLDEAVAELQQAVKDPRHRAAALLHLGRAFQHKGLPDLALGQLEKALEAAGASGALGKEILYDMGTIALEHGRQEVAFRHYSRILEQDIGYRDVAQKIQRLQKT